MTEVEFELWFFMDKSIVLRVNYIPSLSAVKHGSIPPNPLTVVPLNIGSPRIGVKEVNVFCLMSNP